MSRSPLAEDMRYNDIVRTWAWDTWADRTEEILRRHPQKRQIGRSIGTSWTICFGRGG